MRNGPTADSVTGGSGTMRERRDPGRERRAADEGIVLAGAFLAVLAVGALETGRT